MCDCVCVCVCDLYTALSANKTHKATQFTLQVLIYTWTQPSPSISLIIPSLSCYFPLSSAITTIQSWSFTQSITLFSINSPRISTYPTQLRIRSDPEYPDIDVLKIEIWGYEKKHQTEDFSVMVQLVMRFNCLFSPIWSVRIGVWFPFILFIQDVNTHCSCASWMGGIICYKWYRIKY